MVENSNASYKNEIHRPHSSFNKDSKIQFFSQGGPNFWGRMAGKFRKTAKTGKSIVSQIRK